MAQRRLFDKATLNRLKKYPIYSQDGKGDDAIVSARIFNPYGAGYWNITEYDGKDTMYGYYQRDGHSTTPDEDESYGVNEYGYFSKKELENTRVRVYGLPMPLERDSSFKPQRLGDVIGRKKQESKPQSVAEISQNVSASAKGASVG